MTRGGERFQKFRCGQIDTAARPGPGTQSATQKLASFWVSFSSAPGQATDQGAQALFQGTGLVTSSLHIEKTE